MYDNVNYSEVGIVNNDNIQLQGQGKYNQLGGHFINGRPLPIDVRIKIIKMYSAGVRPCQISRGLRVSHGCVSKILNRFYETGSIEPGLNGSSKSRLPFNTYGISSNLCKKLHEYLKENPFIEAWALHNKLITDKVCSFESVPPIDQINLFLKSRNNYYQQYFDASTETLPNLTKKKKERRPRTSFSRAQLDILEDAFKEKQYADNDVLENLSAKTNLDKLVITVWFCNRRSRERKICDANENSGTALPACMSPNNNNDHGHINNNMLMNSVISDMSESDSSIDSSMYMMNSPHLQLQMQPQLQPQPQQLQNQQIALCSNQTFGHPVYDCNELNMISSPRYILPPSERTLFCNAN